MSSPPFYRTPPNPPAASFHKPAPIPKAPIVNPYEKFTQPQFDAWIGDITGALRGALGYRAALPAKPKARIQWHIPAPRSTDAIDDADAELDDSFADVKSRRPAAEDAKGKGRDPREGPGLGKGDRGAPIEIDLNSAGEEEEEEWDEDEELHTSDEEDEEENALRNGESSAHAHARYQRYADRREDEAEDQVEDEYEDEKGGTDNSNAIEVVSDDEEDGERGVNGLLPQDDEDYEQEYSDEEDANPTSVLVAPHEAARVADRDYSDDGEETGSDSEDDAVAGSSPPRQATHPDFYSDKPRYVDDMFGEEDDELDDDVVALPPQREHSGPEIVEVLSNDEDEGREEQDDHREGFAERDEQDDLDEQDPRIQPQLRIQRDARDTNKDDVLPGSSPILSSPIEPEHSFPSDNHVFDVDEFEDGSTEMRVATHDQSKPFDWDHPPAFAHGVPASGPGHLATPVDDDDNANSDDYPPLEAYGTSDILPTFQSLSQVQTDSETEAVQMDGKPRGDAAERFFPNLDQEYFVTEDDERDLDDLDHLDAYTVSPSVSAEQHPFFVEEVSTDYEPDNRGISLDVVTIDGEMDTTEFDTAHIDETEIREAVSSEVHGPLLSRQVSQDARDLEVTLSSSLNEEPDSRSHLLGQQGTVEQHRDADSFIHDNVPMPVLADPTAYDPASLRQSTTPPRVPMVLSLPGSPFLLSPVATPSGQPTPVSLPVPASLLKVMHQRQGSSLFTPSSELPSARATPPVVPSAQMDDESGAQTDTEPAMQTAYFDIHEVTPVQVEKVENHADTKQPSEPAHDEVMVGVYSVDVDAGMEDSDNVIVIQEKTPGEPQDAVPEAEVPQLTPIEEIPTVVNSSEENNEPAEPIAADEALYWDQEATGAQGEEPVATLESYEAATPSSSLEEMYTTVAAAKSEQESVVPLEEEPQADFFPRDNSNPTETSAAGAPPVSDLEPSSDSLATVEHPDRTEEEMISDPSLSVGDPEKLEDGDAMVASQDQDIGDEVELQYPPESDVKLPANVDMEMDESVDAADDVSDGPETDATGQDDPDYEDSSSASSVAEGVDVNEKSDADEKTADDPVLNELSSRAVEDDTSMEDKPKSPADLSGLNQAVVIIADPDAVVETSEEEKNNDTEVPQEVSRRVQSPETNGSALQSVHESIPVDVEFSPPVQAESPTVGSSAVKRKRDHPLEEPALTSTNLGKMAESRLLRPYKPQSNGKGKAKEEYIDNDDASSTSSASSAARMLNPGSRGTSRASSIASVRSAKSSGVVESSPSSLPRVNSIIRAARPTPKLLPPPPPPPPPPPTLIHAHSHHRHHLPALSRQPTQPRLLQRTPSRNNVNEQPSTPSTSSMQMPPPPLRAPPAAGSPVTRSNCRYHKITLPEFEDDEGGPRVAFLVPGCSLGDKELMDEENIKDEGDATGEEGERMVKDLDSFHFDSYLMGTLRQLVGVDLLREQEVFYLPPPGVGQSLPKPPRGGHSRLRISSGGSFASESALSPPVLSPGSSRAPNSLAGSSSTASVKTRRRKRSDRGSPTPVSWVQSQGESTDDESPSAKRIRGGDEDIRAAEAEGIAAAKAGSPLRTRRSKRMDKEAMEYKPEGPDAVEDTSDEENNKGRKKKKRGVKRGRQSEAAPAQDGGEDRKKKKLKTHESNGDAAA